MKPLVESKHSKNKKTKDDGLAIQLEPSTYESAAKVYGVDFRPDYIKVCHIKFKNVLYLKLNQCYRLE